MPVPPNHHLSVVATRRPKGSLALTARGEWVVRARALNGLRFLASIPPRVPGYCIRVARMSAVRSLRTGLATILVSATVMSCATDATEGTLALADGSKLTDLLTEGSCGVVLTMSPRECLSCNGLLETWVERGRALEFEFHLLMTETPSPKQVEALSLRRVRLSGVVSESHAISEPRAYLVADRVVRDSIVGVTEQTLFLSRLMSVRQQNDCWRTAE